MLTNIKNKFKKEYMRQTHLYYQEIIASLQDTSKERSFSYYIEENQIDLETYVSFSPENLLEEYFQYIDPFFKTAKDDLLLMTGERIHLIASIFIPSQTQSTYLYLNRLLDEKIIQEKEALMIEASVVINNILASISPLEEIAH